ncbi:SDR family NAD(P)-dependent oxidoreductase [Niabella aurantiaca]|uniref:SDR family NAD(P)-dependent oxidoreductase n=1 Tax=Niabella aurantiaca TaxID=379900 RepID=UPI0003756C0C|nr:SDR family oxidoreductase [Niabella aurantiaca]
MFRIDGKVAVVTGGAGLFGKPISGALAEAGAHVVIASRDQKKCDAFAAGLRESGLSAVGMALDLASEASIREFVTTVEQQYGRIDILVNNAVSREGIKDLEDLTREDIEKSASINTTGLMLLTKHVVKGMREREDGNIINVSSIQGAVGPHFPVYGNTGMSSPVNYTYDKWGMVGFTKWLANYYGRFNIRANCISPGGYGPGLTDTEGKKEFIENYKRLTPLGRFADDDDIKGPVVFLAAPASAYITGQNLMVDGGWTNW